MKKKRKRKRKKKGLRVSNLALLLVVFKWREGVKVEVALLSELKFKHQVTTARGEGGRRGRGA